MPKLCHRYGKRIGELVHYKYPESGIDVPGIDIAASTIFFHLLWIPRFCADKNRDYNSIAISIRLRLRMTKSFSNHPSFIVAFGRAGKKNLTLDTAAVTEYI